MEESKNLTVDNQASMHRDTELRTKQAEKIYVGKPKSKENIHTFNENINESKFVTRDVSIQSTTAEVLVYEVSASPFKNTSALFVLQRLFIKKIMPYYLRVEKLDRRRVLKMIYDIPLPSPINNSETQVSESDFTSQVILGKIMKATSISDLDMTDKSVPSSVPEDIPVRKSPIFQSISEKLPSKTSYIPHKSVSLHVDVDDSIEHADDEKGRKARFSIDSEDDLTEKTIGHESKSDHGEDKSVKTQKLKDLRRFLLEKDISDTVLWKRNIVAVDEDILREKRISVSDKLGEYVKEDTGSSTSQADIFINEMEELMKTSSKVVQDARKNYLEQIRMSLVASNLFWQTMSHKRVQKPFLGWHGNGNITNLKPEGMMGKNASVIESSDINEKLSLHERAGTVRHTEEEIKKVVKEINAGNNGRNVARKSPSKSFLDAVQVFQNKNPENVSKIAKHAKIKILTVNQWIKAKELLNHEGAIYKYSELDEIIPRLWIGDFSAVKTQDKLKNIRYRIILGDCKKCIIDQHDTCNAKGRPFIYTPPFYTTNGNYHCMGIQGIDDATFPIFQYFRSACDFIAKSLSSSTNANVAVISKSGKSRCSAIIMAYLVLKKDCTLTEAAKKLKAKRAIRPNLGFIVQLMQLELKLQRSRKKPVTRKKNLFEIRRKKKPLDSCWVRDEESVAKPAEPFVFLDDRMLNPDRRLGVNTNLFLHSRFSAPGPHFCTNIEDSTLRANVFDMLPFYKLDIATTRNDYGIPNAEGRVLGSFSC